MGYICGMDQGGHFLYRGQVVYQYAFDIAYDMERGALTTLLGQPVTHYSLEAGKRGPRHLFFPRLWMVRLPSAERLGPHGPVPVETGTAL